MPSTIPNAHGIFAINHQDLTNEDWIQQDNLSWVG